MKKALKSTAAFLLVLALILGTAACGSKTETDTDSEEPADKNEETLSGGEEAADSNSGSSDAEKTYEGAHIISLSGNTATLDGEEIEIFDYTWHCDPSVSHDEVKDAPAEYYTGTKPDTTAAAYIDRELYYFPQLPESGFTRVNYDGETEWAYYYTDGEHDDYIFATLPNLGNSLPADMMHTEEEAAENKVLHITRPGTYVLEGTWKGQIKIDLGDTDETFTDENAKVTVILNGVDINCSVAPGIVFYSAYECDNTWEDQESWSADVDTSDAGVTVVIADGTDNTVTGTNVFRMLKTKYKDEESDEAVKTQKKLRKTDAAFYSYVTMNIEGEEENSGTLTVNSGFEGIDSELHLSINGGNITVNSQDDGMNVNEDDVSVLSFNGGNVTLNAAQGAEGDGVDSNGYIVVNGGNVSVNGVVTPDNALDSESGIYYYSGNIEIDGQLQSYTEGSVFRETGAMGGKGFGDRGGMQDFGMMFQDFDMKEFKEKVAELDDDATFEDILEILGIDTEMKDVQLPDGTQPPDMGERPGMPNGQNPPETPQPGEEVPQI